MIQNSKQEELHDVELTSNNVELPALDNCQAINILMLLEMSHTNGYKML
jgi:hypothetical protein